MEDIATDLSGQHLRSYIDTAVELTMQYAPKVVLALLVLLIGVWIINRFVTAVSHSMERHEVEPTLQRFLRSLINITLKALLLISVASMVGIETTSFVAMFGAAGLAIGLALQGSLANFAGGVLILIFRPFKVGDFIDAQGVLGTVKAIEIFSTVLTTPDNKVIIVPNGAISNGIITNFSREATRRVDMSFGIGYGDDIARAREVLLGLIGSDDRIMADPQPQVVVSELGESSINFAVRMWVASADYWNVYFDMTEKTKLAFDAAGISIPFPQRDVHLYREGT